MTCEQKVKEIILSLCNDKVCYTNYELCDKTRTCKIVCVNFPDLYLKNYTNKNDSSSSLIIKEIVGVNINKLLAFPTLYRDCLQQL